MDWSGKVAVITGASSGIGSVMAKDLDARGAVAVIAARSEDKLRELSRFLKGRHGVYKLDVTSTEEVNAVMDRIRAEFGRIDILINNAGYGVFDKLTEASLETIEDMMDVNYMGTVRCIKAVLPGMLEARRGHIVNIASMAGKIGTAKSTGYSATKHAVLGFTNSLRQEIAGSGVTISAINPGPVDTPFFDRADPSGDYIRHMRWMMLKPEEVSRAALRAIAAGRAEIDLPRMAGAGIKLYQLFPRLADKLAHRFLNRK